LITLENRELSGHDPVDNGQQTGPASANAPLYQYHKEQQKQSHYPEANDEQRLHT